MSQTTSQGTRASKQEGQMGRWARYYDFLMVLMTFGREAKLRQMTVDLARIKEGDRVLEIGCGTGTLTLAAKRSAGASGEATGIDIAPEMVAAAKRKADRRHAAVSFQLGSIDNIPFPDSRFDAVMCSFMIFHMPDEVRRKGFAEIRRVLKPGGHLLILDFAWPDRMGYQQYHLRTLVPVLKGFAFDEVVLEKVKFMSWLGAGTAMGIWYLRGKAPGS